LCEPGENNITLFSVWVQNIQPIVFGSQGILRLFICYYYITKSGHNNIFSYDKQT
jgi:hypothetical protein